MPYVSASASKSEKGNDSRYARVIVFFFITSLKRVSPFKRRFLIRSFYNALNNPKKRNISQGGFFMLQYNRYTYSKREYKGLMRETGDDILFLHEASKSM